MSTPETKNGKIIGSGSYGDVFLEKPGAVVKKSELFEDVKNLRVRSVNIKEAIFLSSFSKIPEYTEFIPKLLKIDQDWKTNELSLNMENCGKNLEEWTFDTPYSKRLEFLPDIICQLARILIFFNKHKLAHMDLKPQNLCIDESGKLKIVDFGFVAKDVGQDNVRPGTYAFMDPQLLRKERISLTKNDMYSVGVTCLFILCKSVRADGMEDLYEDDDLEEFFDLEAITRENNKKYIDLIRMMLSFSDRVSPMELYTHFLLDSVRHKYPIVFSRDLYNSMNGKESLKTSSVQLEQPIFTSSIKLHSGDVRKVKEYPIYKKQVFDQTMSYPHLRKYCGYMIKLFHRYESVSTFEWRLETIKSVMYSIIKIVSILFEENVNVPEKDTIHVLNALNFDVFPIVQYCEDIIDKSNLSFWCKSWVEVCCKYVYMTEEVKMYTKEFKKIKKYITKFEKELSSFLEQFDFIKDSKGREKLYKDILKLGVDNLCIVSSKDNQTLRRNFYEKTLELEEYLLKSNRLLGDDWDFIKKCKHSFL